MDGWLRSLCGPQAVRSDERSRRQEEVIVDRNEINCVYVIVIQKNNVAVIKLPFIALSIPRRPVLL